MTPRAQHCRHPLSCLSRGLSPIILPGSRVPPVERALTWGKGPQQPGKALSPYQLTVSPSIRKRLALWCTGPRTQDWHPQIRITLSHLPKFTPATSPGHSVLSRTVLASVLRSSGSCTETPSEGLDPKSRLSGPKPFRVKFHRSRAVTTPHGEVTVSCGYSPRQSPCQATRAFPRFPRSLSDQQDHA